MVWKETSHTSSVGDSATFAAEDINKISRMLNGSDVDDVTIGLDWTFGSGKLNTPNIKNTGTLTLPTSTDTLVGRATTDTLTNKTLTLPVISAISNSGTVTFPTGSVTLATLTGSETLTNKTITTPIIATISNGGTLTLPTSTDTLVGRDTTDTLTNKTLDSSNTISSATSLPVVTVAKGGTGAATATLGFDALSPMTTAGDIIIGGASGTRTRLGIGTANQLLRTNSGATAPEWASTLSGLTLTAPTIATITNSGTITVPTGTLTLATVTGSETLTNKTLTTPVLTTPTVNGMRGGDVGITNSDSPYTALATTRVIRADATSGAITINLPTAVGIAGHEYHIFRTDIISSTNIITIDANSTETIDSNLTYRLYPAEWMKIESDGANWQCIGRSTPTEMGYYFDKGSTTNRRYFGGHAGNVQTTTTAPAINTLWALPLIVGRTTKFDTISFRMTTNQTGNARAGIYIDNGNCFPGALYFDTGAISVTAGTLKDTTITSSLQVFQPGLYWLAWECDVANLQLKGLGTQTNLLGVLGSVDTFQTANSGYGWTVAHTFGALPDPFTTSATVLTANPAVGTPIPAIGLRPI